MPFLSRALGVATTGFGVLELVKPDAAAKGKAVGAAVGYAALNALSLLGNRR